MMVLATVRSDALYSQLLMLRTPPPPPSALLFAIVQFTTLVVVHALPTTSKLIAPKEPLPLIQFIPSKTTAEFPLSGVNQKISLCIPPSKVVGNWRRSRWVKFSFQPP